MTRNFQCALWNEYSLFKCKGEHNKAKAKTEPKVEKEKKHFKFQCPVKIVKDEPEAIEDVDFNEVEETEEEN